MCSISVPTKILKTLETSSSLGMFARDTGGCLTSKLALSRSKDEAKEIAFSELAESALFYLSAPVAAKAASNIFSKGFNVDKKQMTEPLYNIKNLGKEQLKNIKLAKFAQIGTVFSLILPFVFAIAPVRNIMTYSDNGKEEFVSVVGLKKTQEQEKREEAKEKAKKLVKKLAKISAVSIGATAVIAAASKNDKIYDKTKNFITGVVDNLGFSEKNDLKLSHYGALIYPVSIASYFYASRDKYEKEENARRFSVTVPLLFYGERAIEKPIHKGFDKLFNTKVMENGKIKSYEEILKMPCDVQKKFLKSKNWAYGLTFLTNTMLIAGAVALLNRIATKKKYERENGKTK
ncbi:hypothetical protein IJ182_04220 [bacterium]|nr:hypothetical protein [bacterium]